MAAPSETPNAYKWRTFSVVVQGIGNRNNVVPFLPTVGDHIAAAFSVCARIDHHDAIAVAKQKLGVTECAGAIVRDTVEEQDPIFIGCRGTNFPAMQFDPVRCANSEILFGRLCPGQHLLGFLRSLRIQVRRVENTRANSIAYETLPRAAARPE